LPEHVFSIFKGNIIRERRKRIQPEVKMGWGDYTFTKLEMCYAGDAIEVSSFTYHIQLSLVYLSPQSSIPFPDFTFHHNDIHLSTLHPHHHTKLTHPTQAIRLQIQGNREHNNRKLSAAEQHCRSLLSDDNLPPVWNSMLNMAMASLDKSLWTEYFKAGVEAWKLTGRGKGDRLWEDMKRKLKVLEQRMGEWERNGCRFEMRRKGEGGRDKKAKDGRVTGESGKDESKPETTE
jgi:hypothetical protein